VSSGIGRQRRAVTTLAGDPARRCSATFAALADPSRLRLVRLLAERPRYGQELAQELDLLALRLREGEALMLQGTAPPQQRAPFCVTLDRPDDLD
jgi:hypothetical protein